MKILVIDDEPDIRTFLQVLFEENGHEVVTASSPRKRRRIESSLQYKGGHNM